MKSFYIFILGVIFLSSCGLRKQIKEDLSFNDSPPQKHVDLSIDTSIIVDDSTLTFPIIFRVHDTSLCQFVPRAIERLDDKFADAEFEFEELDCVLDTFPTIGELRDKNYEKYFNISQLTDIDYILQVWVVDKEDPCTEWGCSLTNGFSMVNGTEGNLVLCDIGLFNPDVICHEMGHWFGLYHTFKKGGDGIDDTPIDPGPIYSAICDYEDCVLRYKDYHPMINNLMGYFPYCHYKGRYFTPGQIKRIKGIGWTHKFKYAFSQKDYSSLSDD